MEDLVLDGVVQLLEDGVEDPVVEGEVAVRMRVDEPASERGFRVGQLSLDGVLGQDGGRLLADAPVPFEVLTLERNKLNFQNIIKNFSLLSANGCHDK